MIPNEGPAPLEVQELDALARAYYRQPERVLSRAREAAERALKSGETELAGYGFYIAGEALLYLADFDQAVTLLERAVFLLGREHRLYPRALTALGKRAYFCEEYTQALEIFYQVYDSALGSNDLELLGIAYIYIGRIFALSTHFQKAYDSLVKGAEAAELSEHIQLQGIARLALGELFAQQGEDERAAEQFTAARQLLASAESVDKAFADLQQASLLIRSGETESAEELIREAVQTARIHRLNFLQMEGLYLSGELLLVQNRPERAYISYRESLHIAQAYASRSYIKKNSHALLQVSYSLGKPEELFSYGQLLWNEVDEQNTFQLRHQVNAIEESHRLEGVKRERDLYKRRADDLERDKQSIHLISRAFHEIVSSVNMDVAFEAVKRNLRQLFTFEGLALCRYDQSDGTLSLSYSYFDGSCSPSLAAEEILRHGYTCIASGSMVHLRQTDQDEDSQQPLFQSAAALPLESRGERLGVLVVLDRNPFNFSAREIDVFSTIADFLAVSLVNQQMVIELKRSNAELTEKQRSLAGTLEQLRIAHEKIEHLATYDQLTKLPNRYLFNIRLEEIIHLSRRNKSSFGLFFIDLDKFKEINDTFGHRSGDTALHIAAARMQRVLRKSDLIARMGGDEFIAVFNTIREISDLAFIAGKLLQALSEPLKFGSGNMNLAASIGISIFPLDGGNAGQLIEHADHALYAAKDAGRGCYRFYSSPPA